MEWPVLGVVAHDMKEIKIRFLSSPFKKKKPTQIKGLKMKVKIKKLAEDA